MPLDTSTYALSLLRLDGRRWNELRRLSAQISTQAASDGSSYVEMGNTKVICTITGPAEGRRGGGGGGTDDGRAAIEVEIGGAGFGGERRRKGGGRSDRRTTSLQTHIASAFATTCLTQLYPHSTIHISISVLSADGALLACCLNAATLALIDAGVPMLDFVVACTAGSTFSTSTGTDAQRSGNAQPDPLLDLSSTEELELPWLTVATVGAGERVCVLVLEKRVRVEWVEGMLAVGVDGCKQVRDILDGVVRRHGRRMLDRDGLVG